MKKKRFLTVFLCVVLSVVCLFGLVACKDETEETPPPVNKNTNIQANLYLGEVGSAVANSLNANFATGFNIAFNGSIEVQDIGAYNFEIGGNIIPANAEDNKSFKIEVKDKTSGAIKFGAYNDAQNLYITSEKVKANVRQANIMDVLRYIIAENGGDLSGNLADTTAPDLAEQMVPLIFSVLAKDNSATDKTSDLVVNKNGNIVTINVFGDNLKDLLDSFNFDYSFIFAGIVLEVNFDISGGYLNAVNVKVKNESNNFNFSVNSANQGLFGAINQDFDPKIPEELKALPESSMIQTDISGKVNLKDSKGNVLRALDWKLMSKIDLFTLLHNNFDLSKLPADNFFHFQISHTCDATCEEFCAGNMMSVTNAKIENRHKKTAIVDVAYDSADFGANNIHVEIGMFDLLTSAGVQKLLKDGLGAENLTFDAGLINQMLSPQLVLNIDTQAANKVPVSRANGNIIIPQINTEELLPLLMQMFMSSDIRLSNLTELLQSVFGKNAVLGKLTVADIINCTLGMPKQTEDNQIVAQVMSIGSTTVSKKLFADAVVADYNTFDKAAKYNIDGSLRASSDNNIYQGTNQENVVIGGTPAAKIVGIEKDANGFAILYQKDSQSGELTKVIDGATTITADDWANKYANGKNLYFKYTYIDYNGNEQTGFAIPLSFAGINFGAAGEQDIEIIAGNLDGNAFANVWDSNFKQLFESLGLDSSLINDFALNISSAAFNVKINIAI